MSRYILDKFVIWIDETETFHKELNKKAIEEIKKYGYVVYYFNNLDKTITDTDMKKITKEIGERL